jgi:hypothetical protein
MPIDIDGDRTLTEYSYGLRVVITPMDTSSPTLTSQDLVESLAAIELIYTINILANRIGIGSDGSEKTLIDVLSLSDSTPLRLSALRQDLEPRTKLKIEAIQMNSPARITFGGVHQTLRELRQTFDPLDRALRREELRHKIAANRLTEKKQTIALIADEVKNHRQRCKDASKTRKANRQGACGRHNGPL